MIKLSEIWKLLEADAENAPDEGILTRYLFSKLGFSVGIEIKSRNKLLLFELEDPDLVNSSQLPQWEGVKTDIRVLGSKKLISLTLENEDSLHIFNALINDFYNAIQGTKDKTAAYQLFIEILFKWYEFFKKFGVKVLSETTQRGIFGELYFLLYYLLRNYDSQQIIKSWQGPEKKRHDFTFRNGNIEIKSTIRKAPQKVIIASEKQLDDTGLPFLYLYCITLNMDSNNGVSLPGIVADIREVLSKNHESQYKFNHQLEMYGYLDEHEHIYKTNKYIFTKDYLFHVKENFPRILNVDEGVGDVKYSLAISSCMSFISDIESSIQGLIQNEN